MKKGISMRRRLAAQDEIVRELEAHIKANEGNLDVEALQQQLGRIKKTFQMEA